MSERTPHAKSNGRAHLLALGCQDALPADVRAQIAAEGDVEWVRDIYYAAAQIRCPNHGYRALLLDLRALSRPHMDAAMAMAARAGLAVWLLPMDAGHTRTHAAITAGAVPWARVLDQVTGPPRVSALKEAASPTAVESLPRLNTAGRISSTILGDALGKLANGHSPSPVPPSEPFTNGHKRPAPMAPATAERPAIRDIIKQVLPEIAPPVIAPARFPEQKSESSGPAIEDKVAPPAMPVEPQVHVPPVMAEATGTGATARSENDATPETAKVQMTLDPPAEYDEISPVLSEEELRALLGPPE